MPDFRIIRNLASITPQDQNCVATIGNFDGVHLGHQAIFKQVAQLAQQLKTSSLVITFEPPPQSFFDAEHAPARLCNFREKILLLQQQGIDKVLVLRFDEKIANLSPQQFIKKLLVEKLAIKHLIIGDDFRFGKGRQGDAQTLFTADEHYGFEVTQSSSFIKNSWRVSSSLLRDALLAADFELVEQLLGRPYTRTGKVVAGAQLGRSIGVPTANIHLGTVNKIPVSGVFIVEVSGLGPRPLPAVANWGSRPTVNGLTCQLEVHLLNFQADIYNQYLTVRFLHKLRDEKKFTSLTTLRQQLMADIHAAEQYFAATKLGELQ